MDKSHTRRVVKPIGLQLDPRLDVGAEDDHRSTDPVRFELPRLNCRCEALLFGSYSFDGGGEGVRDSWQDVAPMFPWRGMSAP